MADGLGDLKRRRSAGLLLDHCGAVAKRIAGRYVANLELDQVAAPEAWRRWRS